MVLYQLWAANDFGAKSKNIIYFLFPRWRNNRCCFATVHYRDVIHTLLWRPVGFRCFRQMSSVHIRIFCTLSRIISDNVYVYCLAVTF